MTLENTIATSLGVGKTSGPVAVQGPQAIALWGTFTSVDLEMTPDCDSNIWIKVGSSITTPSWVQLNPPKDACIRVNNIVGGTVSASCGRIQGFGG